MAKAKYRKKDPDAEQQTIAGVLYPQFPPPQQLPYAVGDWIIYHSDGSKTVMPDADFQLLYEKA